MLNNLRFVIVFFVLCSSHHQIYNGTLPIYFPNNFTTPTTVTTTAAVTTHATFAPTSSCINYAAATAMLSQLHAQNQTSLLQKKSSSHLSTNTSISPIQELLEEEKKYKTPRNYPYVQERATAQRLAEQTEVKRAAQAEIKRAAQAETLQHERAQIRAEKEILEKFIDTRHDIFTEIERKSVRPIQWGDRFPISKPFFSYIRWRETDDAIEQRITFEAQAEAQEIACQHMKLSMIMALVAASHNHPEQTMKFFIDHGMDCDFSSSGNQEKNTQKNANVLFRKNNNHNTNNFIDGEHTQQLDDVMYEGERCKHYVFVDDNGQYTTGYFESYDGQRGGFFICQEYLTVPTNKIFQGIQQFHAYHGQSVQNMKVHILTNTTHYHKAQIDAGYLRGDITDSQAIDAYQKIEYTAKLQEAQAAVKQYEKMHNPSFFRRAINYFSGTSSQTTSPHNAVKNIHTQPSSSSQPTTIQYQIPDRPSPLLPIENTVQSPTVNSATSQLSPSQNSTQTAATPLPKPGKHAPENLSPAQAVVATVINNGRAPHKSSPTPTPDCEENKKEIEAHRWRRQQLEAQDTWMHNHMHTHTIVATKEQNMLHHMHNVIIDAENDTTIEIAQLGLRAWEQALNADSNDERKHHLKKFYDYHNAIEHKTPSKSIAQQALPARYSDIENLLEDYEAAIQLHQNELDHDKQICNLHSDNQDQTDVHLDRCKKRAQALAQTKSQLNARELPYQTYDISPQARGFMMANNMNYAAFNGAHVTQFQHCLTQEIVGIIEHCASTAQHYSPTSIVGQLALNNCNLAISAQQLSQAAHVQEAAAVTDVTHFFDACLQFLVDSDMQSQAMIDIGLGMTDGTIHALQKWGNFLQQLGCQPGQTIGKITNDCKAISTCLYNIVDKACEFMPHAYLNDMNQEFLDNFQKIKCMDDACSEANHQSQTNVPTPSRMMQRSQRNAHYIKDGLYGALQAAQKVIDTMMQQSLRQNIACGTEIIVDNMITAKATDCLIKVATCIGTPILQVAEKLTDNIPSHLHDATPTFMTSAGELVAVTEVGENIGAAVAEHIIKNAAQVKALHAQATNNNSGQGGGGDNKQKTTPAPTYTYEHGKYKQSPKHHANSPDHIGKPPRDGQTALDNSFEVRKSTQRITVQDGKVVILKWESEGVYHGYIVEDLNSLTKPMKDPLIEHGFMKNATTKKLTIKK